MLFVYGGMMDYGGSFGLGGMIFGGVFMLLFWAALILLVIWLYKQVSGAGALNGGQKESALDILKKRYASGEIDKKEFEEKKKDLTK